MALGISYDVIRTRLPFHGNLNRWCSFLLYAHNIRIVNFDKITKVSAAVDVSLSENIKSIVVLYNDRHVE